MNFKFSVLGEVNNPGSYQVDGQRVTIFDAISRAGDLNIDGNRDIVLIREMERDRKIVKLVIQPLVENAIYHGIKYLDGKGMLLILGEIQDGKVVITIRDNGVGMDEETLKHILEKKPEPKEKQRKKTSHVGVYNVQNRLQLYYGKEYGLVYESMPGMGTGVSVIIPAEGGEES